MDYIIHYQYFESYRKLSDFFNDEMLENCVLSGANNVRGYPHMGCIAEWFEEEHAQCDYKGEIKACVISVDFSGIDYRPADLDTVTGIVHLICDYFCDHQNFYGLFREDRERCKAYFVISPLYLDVKGFRMINAFDISTLCHMSRLDRNYRGSLKPLFQLENLMENDEDDFYEDDDDFEDDDFDWCDDED